jgi:hypothetical protein
MRNPNRSPFPEDQPRFQGYHSSTEGTEATPRRGLTEIDPRLAIIVVMGAIGYKIEAGPNAQTPEILPSRSDLGPQE